MSNIGNSHQYPRARSLAIFGTASDVGKSITVTALCRIFRDMGLRVAPFKAQNMSNNSFVSLSQGELARAQAVQAEAAGIEPTVDMNPVLLKPSGDQVAQVILRGQVLGNRTARAYFSDTKNLFQEAAKSLDRLRSEYDLVIIEGAGSCAEVNLRAPDYTNFEMAHHANAPVILVADIDRGGVFAQIIGTLDLLDKRDRERVKGILINRFRGDPKLFEEGIRFIEAKTSLPVLGLVPQFSNILIDSEDGLPMTAQIDTVDSLNASLINIGVILLPHISNFTDFLPLEAPGSVEVHYFKHPKTLAGYDLILIPGSKNVRGDLEWLHASGWSERLHSFRALGGTIGGICGGYQILGNRVSDPEGIEGEPGVTEGLKMLPIETVMAHSKQLHRTRAIWEPTGQTVAGYEIHHGITTKIDFCRSLLKDVSRNNEEVFSEEQGALSADGKVWGCYLHGLFDEPVFRKQLLESVSKNKLNLDAAYSTETPFDYRQRQYDLLAKHFKEYVDVERLHALFLDSY